MPPTNSTDDENNASWTAFIADANDDDGLEWEFSNRSLSSTFLEMNITIQPYGKLKTILYEKPMALYLFFTTHLAHPPWRANKPCVWKHPEDLPTQLRRRRYNS